MPKTWRASRPSIRPSIRPVLIAGVVVVAPLLAACGSTTATATAPSTTAAPVSSIAAGAPSTTAAPKSGATAKVSANTASAAEIEAALTAAGVTNAARWTREVMEYRPYDTSDPTLATLKKELQKYNPSADTLTKILSALQP